MPRPVDPVTDYARRVTGPGTSRRPKIIAGRGVVLACQRHLEDREQSSLPTYPYEFDESAAQHIIDFYPKFITLEDGATPLILANWAAFCLGAIFGWRRKNDHGRRFQVAYIETGKGSGKTSILAAVGLYALAFDSEPSSEVYAAAFDRGQAGILLRDAIRMAEESPTLSSMLEISKHNIAHVPSGSFFRAVSSEHRSKSGPRPHVVLIDELHEHRDGTVVNKMRAGFKARQQPLIIEITNAGHDRTSICWSHHEHSMSVLQGTVTDDQWFAYVCQLDPCRECALAGWITPKDGCADCDDWTNPKVWPKTNPSLYISLPRPEYLKSQVETALAIPATRALTKRLNFCSWTVTRNIWIPPDQWDACRVPSVLAANPGLPCAAGFDMSEKLDLTSGVVLIRVEDDGPGDTVEIAQEPGAEPVKLNLNFFVDVVPFFWLPAETLVERVRTDRIPYDVWQRSGYLRVTPGPVIDHDLIFEQFTTDIAKRYRPQIIGYDARHATQFAVALRDKAKFEIVDVPQGRRLSESFKLFEALVRLRRVRHDGNPVMGWCVSNAEPKFDRYSNLWLEKPIRTTLKIDGVIAAVIALSQLVLLPATVRKKHRMPMLWTKEKFVPAVGTVVHP